MTEVERLHELLKEDWGEFAWMSKGDAVEGFTFVEEIEGEEHRWFRPISVVLQSEKTGKYYMWHYDRGLTEMQEHEYDGEAPVEVFPEEVIIKKTEWRKVPL